MPTLRALITRRTTFYFGWWLVAAAMLAQFISIGVQVFVTPLFLKPMTEALGWSRTDFIFATTVGQFVMAGLGFWIGGYLDRYGPRPLMLIGAIILGLSTYATSYVTELWQWLLLRGVIMTMGTALVGNLVVNVTLSKWFVEQRGRAIGIAAMGFSLGSLVMPPIISPIIENYGWEVAWRVLAVLGVILTFPAAMVMRRQPEDYGLYPDGKSPEEVRAGGGQRARDDYAQSFTRREALRSPQLYLLILAFALSGAATSTVLSQGPAYVSDAGFAAGTAALMVSVYSIPSALTKPVWGWISEHINPRYLSAISFVIAFIAAMCIVAATRLGSLSVLVVGFVLMGLGQGAQVPLMETIWGSYFGRRYLGQVRGVALPFSLVIGGSAPVFAALYFDRVGSYEVPFLTMSFLWLTAAVFILLSRRPTLPGRMLEAGPETAVPAGKPQT